MLHISANLDIQTDEVIATGRLHDLLHDLCEEEELRIIFVARDIDFDQEAWKEDDESYMRVILPYEEVLITDNIDLLVANQLYDQLDQLEWLNVEALKKGLEEKIEGLYEEEIGLR